MKKVYLILLAAFVFRLAAFPQSGLPPNPPAQAPTHRDLLRQASPASYWQQEVDYRIDVSLNDIEHTLDGFARIQYTNHSPDTLRFIWFHCWPNAYKNDETAFSEQTLANGKTNFYFSDKAQKGYMNHLDFRVDGVIAKMEDHPQYIDVIRIILPRPLPPGNSITISTPFHDKLPFPFSRSGYSRGLYQVTQWYPKPAVYDRNGWHPMPYLDQGEFYSEYGNYDVSITVPKGFTVAATGILVRDSSASPEPASASTHSPSSSAPSSSAASPGPRFSAAPATTLRFRQDRIHDFAWFADKQYHTDHDTLRLASGRIIDCWAYYLPASALVWKNSLQHIKDAIRFHSSLIGEYPFDIVSIAESKMGVAGGMEYPTIAAINTPQTEKELDLTIEHEIGHNWFYAILGTNERRFPWMDEGMNTFYDNRYKAWKYPPPTKPFNEYGVLDRRPEDPPRLYIDNLAKQHLDQPISTSSEDFTASNYGLIAYAKTGLWMRQLQDTLGTPLFDSAMQEYFRTWQFRHPSPEDFRSVIEAVSQRNLDAQFALLDKKGPIPPAPARKTIRATWFYSYRATDKITYINILPAAGYNEYDKFMIGALIHNYDLPPTPFQFLVAPLYATGSRQMNGLARLSYSWFPDDQFQKIGFALSAMKFSSLSGTDSNGAKLSGGFYKIAPSLRLTFRKPTPRSTLERWIEWKTYFIGEKGFDYSLRHADSLYYPTTGKYDFRYLNQLALQIEDQRVLYPYKALLQFQQASAFYRINFTGNYFFNYEKGGGVSLRLFAAKFGYIGGKNSGLDLSGFEPKLTAVRGDEDYTYSNYFLGRNEFSGFSSQQIMMRDGDLKLRTDLFQGLQGRSDNWVAAVNFNSTLPPGLLPSWLPLKLFLDLGTYSEAWQTNPPTDKFLYTAGLQLSLLNNLVNVYAPLFYSGVFGDNLKTVPDENGFWKKISFSIDLQNINLHKTLGPYDF